VRLFGLALLALAVLLGTSLLCAYGLTLIWGGPIITPTNLSVGSICGLVVWLFVAAFHLRKETLSLPAPDRERFLHSARLLLTEMGYEVTSRAPQQLSTRPRFHSLLAGGAMHVACTGPSARISGPKLCVEVLRNRLRIQSHLRSVQETLRDHPRQAEALIKRAELRLQVKPEDLAAVKSNVVDVLKASADVSCELQLHVQSDTGIPESTLDVEVGQWLMEQGIKARLQKHFVQLHRPPSNPQLILGEVV
jgi:hypothetical protein